MVIQAVQVARRRRDPGDATTRSVDGSSCASTSAGSPACSPTCSTTPRSTPAAPPTCRSSGSATVVQIAIEDRGNGVPDAERDADLRPLLARQRERQPGQRQRRRASASRWSTSTCASTADGSGSRTARDGQPGAAVRGRAPGGVGPPTTGCARARREPHSTLVGEPLATDRRARRVRPSPLERRTRWHPAATIARSARSPSSS